MQFIRVDANETIASGHVMRCMTIARELELIGERVVFIVADDYPVEMIKKAGFEVEVLHTDWKDMEAELDKLKEIIAKYGVDKARILVDSYQVTPRYFIELKKFSRCYYIDDGMKDTFEVDGIIAYCHFYKMFDYENRYEGIDLLLGCSYIPLRSEFRNIADKNISQTVSNVMVTTGGADMLNTSNLIANTLCLNYPDLQFNFVIGRFYSQEQIEELSAYAKKYKNIKLCFNAVMSEVMKQNDVAISAGGTTLYELCACKVPTICFGVANNQRAAVETLEDMKIMLSCGCINEMSETEIAQAMRAKFQQIQDYSLRTKLSMNMEKLVDGNGAIRIAEALQKE